MPSANEPRAIGDPDDPPLLLLAIGLLVAGLIGALFWTMLREPDGLGSAHALLEAQLRSLREGRDEEAYRRMSTSYRERNGLAAFRAGVSGLPGLRDARGVLLFGSPEQRWGRVHAGQSVCARLLGIPEEPFLTAILVEEEGLARLEALGVEGRELDPRHPAGRSACRPHRGR